MTKTTLTLLAALLTFTAAAALAQPDWVDWVDFEDTPPGEGFVIDPHRYLSQGVVLGCPPGHHLYTVERDGPGGFYGRSVAVSRDHDDPIPVTVQIYAPGTLYPSCVQRMTVQVLDAAGHLWEWAYTDYYGNPLVSGSNIGDADIGEGFWYSNGPIAHQFEVWLWPGMYIDDIGFSELSEPIANESMSWGEIKALY